MFFSTLADAFCGPPNRLYQEKTRLEKEGIPFTDLVSGNVTSQGIQFPEALLKTAFSKALPQTRHYLPHPLGQASARAAISRYYAAQDVAISPENILVTPGTSVSYWYAFKLLANPGDEILCPSPCYPLFDVIAQLCGVRLTRYHLKATSRWEIDLDDLKRAITPKTKAIVLISPHNPTGAVATTSEIVALAGIASKHGLAIISDEVFDSFLFDMKRLPRPADTSAPLVLTMNGFSKMLALPGIKFGWMALSGERASVEKARQTLEMISDAFLPVSEGVQAAAPLLLHKSRTFQHSYHRTIRDRRENALACLHPSKSIRVLPSEGGLYLTLALPEDADEEAIAYQLLHKHRILVYPGYFFETEGPHLVLSYATRPKPLADAVHKILEVVG